MPKASLREKLKDMPYPCLKKVAKFFIESIHHSPVLSCSLGEVADDFSNTISNAENRILNVEVFIHYFIMGHSTLDIRYSGKNLKIVRLGYNFV